MLSNTYLTINSNNSFGTKNTQNDPASLIPPKRLKFFQNYAPELLHKNGRLTFYIKYEFKEKQQSLFTYWHKLLDNYFYYYRQLSIIPFHEILEFFTINNSTPLGL